MTVEDGVGSFNACCKEIYEKLAAAVFHFTPGYESTPKDDLPPESLLELCFFFKKFKRRFFDGRCPLSGGASPYIGHYRAYSGVSVDRGLSLHEMACIRRYNEPVYIVCTERCTDVY